MALSSNNNYYSTLFSNANDAMSGMFKVDFLNGYFNGRDKTIRCTGFQIANLKQLEYTKKYVTAYIDAPAPKVEGEKRFSITFRLDENYDVYMELLNWRSVLVDPSNSAVDIDLKGNESKFCDIQVSRIGNNGGTEGMATYGKCWCTDVALGGYAYGTSKPQTVTATIYYKTVNDWSNADSGLYVGGSKMKGTKDNVSNKKGVFSDGTTVTPKVDL